MKCPACSAVLPDDSAECQGCGVNFEKWRARAAASSAPAPDPACVDGGVGASDFPFLRVLLAGLLIAGVYSGGKAYRKYLPGGLADPAKPSYMEKGQAAPPPAAAPAGPALDMSGFERVFGEYSAKASMLRIPLNEEHARKTFQYGVADALAVGFDEMEAAGMPVSETPFTEEEKKRAEAGRLGAKCDGKNGTEYLPGLPGNNTDYSNCWQRASGRAKSSAYVQVYYSDIFPRNRWARAQWLPNSGRWSPWTDFQQAQAAVRSADKYYGAAAIQDERQKTEKLMADAMRAGKNAADFAWPLVESFQMRFRREGLLAGADQLRRR